MKVRPHRVPHSAHASRRLWAILPECAMRRVSSGGWDEESKRQGELEGDPVSFSAGHSGRDKELPVSEQTSDGRRFRSHMKIVEVSLADGEFTLQIRVQLTRHVLSVVSPTNTILVSLSRATTPALVLAFKQG